MSRRAHPIQKEKASRKHVWGSTLGDMMGPIDCAPYSHQCSTSFGHKNVMMGNLRQAAGETTPGADSQVRHNDACEPISYHIMHEHVHSEVLHEFGPVKAAIDFTPDGQTGITCCEENVSYIGVGFAAESRSAFDQSVHLKSTCQSSTQGGHAERERERESESERERARENERGERDNRERQREREREGVRERRNGERERARER